MGGRVMGENGWRNKPCDQQVYISSNCGIGLRKGRQRFLRIKSVG